MWNVADTAARLLHPAVQALLLGVVSCGLVVGRRPRMALVTACLALAWIGVASTPWFALALRRTLVDTPPTSPHSVDAIVVLGGGKLPVYDWSRRTTRAGMGYALWRQGFAPVLLVSGSDQALSMMRGLERAGVPAAALRIESTSRNTHENARDSAAILASQGMRDVLLVTADIHMRRAAGSFRHEGVRVTPAPVDDGLGILSQAPAWEPRRDALTLTARCFREHVAQWSYRWHGWM